MIKLGGTNSTWISPVVADITSPLAVNIWSFVNLIGQSQREEFTFWEGTKKKEKKGLVSVSDNI